MKPLLNSININMVHKITGELGCEIKYWKWNKIRLKARKCKNRISLLFFLSHALIYWIIKKIIFSWLRLGISHYSHKYENIMLCTLHSIEMKHTVTVLSHTVAVIYRSTGRSHYCCRYKCWLTLSFASISAPLSSSAVAVSV